MPDANKERTKWEGLCLRLRQIAYEEGRGHAVTIMRPTLWLVNGELVVWSDPTVSLTHLEPSAEKDGLSRLATALEAKQREGDDDGED